MDKYYFVTGYSKCLLIMTLQIGMIRHNQSCIRRT